MADRIYVTRAQKLAAKNMVKRDTARGRVSSEAVKKIAAARPADRSSRSAASRSD